MIQFTKPLYLLLVPPLVYYTWRLSRQSLADLSRFRMKLAVGLRIAILIMLVFALAGARIIRNVSQQCVVFVLDVSDSIPKAKQNAALAYINTALRSMSGDQKAGVIAFGGDASVELAPCNMNRVDRIYSVSNTGNTDVAQALGLALASFPEQCARKIVLLSDGNETLGNAIEQAALVGSNDVSIDVVPVISDLPHEALLDRMIAPGNAKIGEPFDLKVVTVSKEPTVARIRVLRNGEPVGDKTVELPKGKGMFAFQQSVPKAGSYEFQAVLECSADTRPENNVAVAHTMVSGKPKVLYVEGQPGQEKYLAAALKTSNIDVDVRDRSGVPTSIAQMQGYDAMVFSDIPAWNLAPEQMAMIKSGVKDLGIGFTMIGGENSLGAGGYFDTPIEECLPVDMSIRKTKVLPTLSVIVVMDKSGSMSEVQGGRQKIQLANDAAASVVRLLQPIDYVGIVVCHDYPVAAVSLRPAGDKGPIYSEISTIRAEGGGITVFESMKMAYAMMASAPTRQKHVMLLADGSDCDNPNGTVELATLMAKQKMTVTTVAFGEGKDVNFLKAVAYAGKGYFYITRRGSDLKAIFTKDVMTVSKSLVIEEPFVPQMDTSCPELSGVDPASTPPLLGYVATSPKAAARVAMVSHKRDPILATWQYGLGKSAAFTSDCKARWSARWLAWPGYNKLWAQIVRSTMRKSTARDYQTTVDIAGGTGHVAIDAVDEKGSFLNLLKFAGSVVGPDTSAHPIVIEQTGPGRYESSFDAREVGSYVVNVVRKGTDQGAPEVNVISIAYPPEYKDIIPNVSLLKRLASDTSGVYSPEPTDVFRRRFRESKAYTDLWRLLALLAVLILPIDVAVRRVAMSSQQAAEIYATARERILSRIRKARAPKPVQRETLTDSLLQTKKRRVESQDIGGGLASDLGALKRQRQEQPAPSQPVSTTRAKPEPPANKPAEAPSAVPTAEKPEPEEPKSDAGTTSRLLEAKRRAKRDQKQNR